MDTTKQERERLKTLVAVLVAMSTVLGAVFTWRSLTATGSAAGNDAKGVTATLNLQQNKSLTNATLYQHLSGYLSYLTNRTLGTQIGNDAFQKDIEARGAAGPIDDPVALAQVQALQAELRRRTDAAMDSAGISQYFFVTNYLEQDGTYNADRELGEASAEAARYKDVDPEPRFDAADRQRAKGLNLVGVLVILSVAVWFFILSQIVPRQWRSMTMLVGVISLFLGAAIGFSVEVLT